jgi:hypothetical protein
VGSSTRYTVRLEDPNSEEFRIVNLDASSPEQAKALCEDKERQLVAVTLSEEDLASEHERSEQRGRRTGRLVAHEQQVSYAVVSVNPRGERPEQPSNAEEG